MNILIVDIETVPDDVPLDCRPKVSLGNATKPETIAKKEKEWAENPEAQIKKMSCDFRLNKIVSLQCYHQAKDVNSFIESSSIEKIVLEKFWSVAGMVNLIVGFGIAGFDIPTIIQRSLKLGIDCTGDLSMIRKYKRWPVYDLQMILSKNNKPEEDKTLDWYCKLYDLPFVKTGSGSDVYRWYRGGEEGLKKIDQYCRDDVMATKALFEKIIEYYPVNQPEYVIGS